MGKISEQNHQCTSKTPFETQKHALTHIRFSRSGRSKNGCLTTSHKPYRCPWCGFWHIGSTKGKQAIKSRTRRRDRQAR